MPFKRVHRQVPDKRARVEDSGRIPHLMVALSQTAELSVGQSAAAGLRSAFAVLECIADNIQSVQKKTFVVGLTGPKPLPSHFDVNIAVIRHIFYDYYYYYFFLEMHCATLHSSATSLGNPTQANAAGTVPWCWLTSKLFLSLCVAS